MSIIYPISIFGYALIEESRPGKRYWNIIRVYTTIILLLKLIINLSILDSFLNSDTFKNIHGTLRIGLENKTDTWSIIIYMLPEMLIISFIMLNEVMQKLNGVYEIPEGHKENIIEGIDRWKAGGDEQLIKEAHERASNMDMTKYFRSYQE